MGYVDESFTSHVWFAIKFFVVLIILRLAFIAMGFTGYWPILDDVISFLWSTFSEAIKIMEMLARKIFPNIS